MRFLHCLMLALATVCVGCSPQESEAYKKTAEVLGKIFASAQEEERRAQQEQEARDLLLVSATSAITPVTPGTKPSDHFCGSRAASPCVSKATDGVTPQLVEIRGWRIGEQFEYTDGPANFDEFRFNVLLDVGWTPSTDLPASENGRAITPLNTLQAVVNHVTPHNVVFFGFGDTAKSSKLDPGGQVWGGSRAIVIHVEINGWDSRQGGNMEGRTPPAGWKSSRGAPHDIVWAWDPEMGLTRSGTHQVIRNGDYVRIVGLLFEDEPHLSVGQYINFVSDESDDNGGEEGWDHRYECWWEGFTKGRGWMEIHPADFVAILDDPHRGRRLDQRVEIISACDDHSDVRFSKAIVPVGTPDPAVRSTPTCELAVNGGFTGNPSVVVKNELVPQPATTLMGQSIPARCALSIELDDQATADAKLLGAYRASWD